MQEFMPSEEDLDLWLLLANTRHAMLRARQKELALYDISVRQAYVLRVIHDLGDKATLRDVSKHVFRAVNSISTQITGMEKKGLLKKIRDIPGTNKLRFEITDKGLRVYELITKRASIYAIMSVLSEEERQELRFYLDRLLSKSQEMLSSDYIPTTGQVELAKSGGISHYSPE
jgi:DNA-binding MarR family transcriptional regulator